MRNNIKNCLRCDFFSITLKTGPCSLCCNSKGLVLPHPDLQAVSEDKMLISGKLCFTWRPSSGKKTIRSCLWDSVCILCCLCVIFLLKESLKFPPLITSEAETSESSLKVVLPRFHVCAPGMRFYLNWCGTPVESSVLMFFFSLPLHSHRKLLLMTWSKPKKKL